MALALGVVAMRLDALLEHLSRVQRAAVLTAWRRRRRLVAIVVQTLNVGSFRYRFALGGINPLSEALIKNLGCVVTATFLTGRRRRLLAVLLEAGAERQLESFFTLAQRVVTVRFDALAEYLPCVQLAAILAARRRRRLVAVLTNTRFERGLATLMTFRLRVLAVHLDALAEYFVRMQLAAILAARRWRRLVAVLTDTHFERGLATLMTLRLRVLAVHLDALAEYLVRVQLAAFFAARRRRRRWIVAALVDASAQGCE